MAQQTVNFNPSTGDDTSGALRKLDNNVTDHEARILAVKATADAALPKAGGTTAGDLTVGGKTTAAGGTLQVGASGSGATNISITYQGNVVSTITPSPGSVSGFATLAWKVGGSFGGGYGLKDGGNNIGLWSSSGSLVVGFGTNDGALTEQLRLTSAGTLQSKGYQCRTGLSGGYGGNIFNLMWGSGMAVYVDTSNVGTIQFQSSDYRIKDPDSIRDTDGDDLAVVLQWRPVTWRYRDVGAWMDDGITRRSFIAHELKATDPTLVIGEKDAVDEEGNIIPQQLDASAIAARLAGAVQILARQNAALLARIEALENGHG